MRLQQFKNAFVAGEKVVVSGAFNGWGTNNELTLDTGSGLHKVTINIEGLEEATNEFKFRILGTTRTNAGMEYESVSNRALVLGAAGAATNLPTAFFNNLEESRKITFRVDMSTQIAKGNFDVSSNTVSVASSHNGWTAVPLSAQGSGVYGAEVTIDGPLAGIEYKFVNGSTHEPNVSDRTLSGVLPNLQASALDPVLFNNDDGIGPVITRNGLATINLTVGDSYTDAGATAADAIDGSVTVTPSGTVDTSVAGTYTVTYNASDAAGNAATSVTRTVIVAAASGSTFAGWSSNALVTTELVGKYGIGGATSSSAASERPEPGLDSNTLSLSAIVRTNDAKLKVEGEASGSLTNWSTNGVTMTASPNTNGVPEGHQRQVFGVDRTNSPTRQFLRLKATLAP
jgi:hypothetical protein